MSHISTNRSWLVEQSLVGFLILFSSENTTNAAAATASRLSGLPEAPFISAARKAIESGVLVPLDDPSSAWVEEVTTRWAHYGWHSAADYHIATFDYPFVDYATNGKTIDRDLMAQYRGAEPDPEASKIGHGLELDHPRRSASESLNRFTSSLGEALETLEPSTVLSRELLIDIMTAGFGKLGPSFPDSSILRL